MKNYIQKDGYHLKVQVDYEKGGMNWFSGQENKRGYYLYVFPVQIETVDNRVVVESFTLMKGSKKLLFEVSRKSEKAYQRACSMVAENQEFIDRVDERTRNEK
jgi:hypothetical protein